MFNNIEAAIFDMDGTIVDSMWIWDEIDREYLAKHGIDVPPTLSTDIAHLNFHDVALYFKNTFNLPYEQSEIEGHWNDMAFEAYAKKIKLKDGVREFFEMLKSKNIKIALATSNNMLLLEACLKANGIYEYFDSITLTSEVSRGKDFPDVYLLSAEKLGATPENCVVFEDLLTAVKGAKQAGMKVIGVYDEASKEQHADMKELADDFIVDYHILSQAI
ncbi:MAG: HAD family phosphatase [Clostridium sp.]|uniref:HAD family hydrolase n=1 Tax=Clostridium culturomicium TaxID=1499683 RepID=UPI002906B07C|nr:HAD family phosphatase [Clostridium sp.]MDU7085238.1 HAD family phosphatase [Clostridium sp.]